MYSFAQAPEEGTTDWWLQQEKLILSVLGARSVTSVCWQGHAPCKGSREGCFPAFSWFLVVARSPWRPLTCSCITPTSAFVLTWPSPSVLCPMPLL